LFNDRTRSCSSNTFFYRNPKWWKQSWLNIKVKMRLFYFYLCNLWSLIKFIIFFTIKFRWQTLENWNSNHLAIKLLLPIKWSEKIKWEITGKHIATILALDKPERFSGPLLSKNHHYISSRCCIFITAN
jgi:hypothetical protein